MLTSIRLENFRCFKNHEIPLRPRTIIVGRNNAGKSTVVEALRLVSIIAERYKTVSYTGIPKWLEIYRGTRGIMPSLDNQAFDFERVFHGHGKPPAKITARFESGAMIEVYIGPESEVFGVISDSSGRALTGKGDAWRVTLPSVGALPQVAPLRYPEQLVTEERVKRYLNSALAPLHFRNQIHFLQKHYEEFKRISEETWPSLVIRELRKVGRPPEATLELHVRNEEFVADVSWMGHGLQMWLQTMWFLARTKSFSSVILDEPDVYMHADLQRKLIRFIRGRYQQIIVATHSIEILSEVEPDDVLVLDKERRAAQFAADWPEVQHVINHVGGIHNIQLARMTHSQKCVMVEGDDLDLLRRFHDRLFPDSVEPIQSLPVFSIGGWGGWDFVVGSSMWIRQSLSAVRIYCALDRDYHTEQQVEFRRKQALDRGIELMVWPKKELENYALVPSAIARLVNQKCREPQIPVDTRVIECQLEAICESLREDTIEDLAGEIQASDRSMVYKTVAAKARQKLMDRWTTLGERLGIVGGKKVFSALNRWLQSEYKVSIMPGAVIQTMSPSEIHNDVRAFLTALEFREPLS